MASRFYFEPTIAADVNPAFDAGWEQNGQAVRRLLTYARNVSVATALTNSSAITVPITTSQDILCYQFVSKPLKPRRIQGTCNFVMRAIESATTANVNLAGVVKAFSLDGSTALGTLFSVFGTGTEFATGTAATRFWSAQALTPLTVDDFWRLVVEIGATAAAPTAATTYTLRAGFNAASDLAYSSGVTTDNNPSFEMSDDLFGTNVFNYQFPSAGDGMSVSEKLR